MTADKVLLRKTLKAKRPSGDTDAIIRRIMEHPWYRSAKTVMAFWAVSPEPELRPLLEDIIASGKKLLLPRCDNQTVMTARWVRSLDALIPGAFGIMEPPEALETVRKQEIDLILVPGLAFDRKCTRLGRGRGYYDRYLADFHGKTLGVCFQASLLDTIIQEPHDRPVNAVVTDEIMIQRMEDGLCLGKSAM